MAKTTQQEPATEQEVPEIVDHLLKPGTTFTIGLQELAMMEQALAPFQWVSSILNNLKNTAASSGNAVPTYKSDYLLDKDGEFILKNNRPQLRPDFWESKKS
jgi:hypothetical protein